MPRELAAKVARALNVRSGSAVREIDQALSAYARLVPQAATVPLSGSIDTSQVTTGTFADARIAESNVTQHEAALSITEIQITDLGNYPEKDVAETITEAWTFADQLRATGVVADTITADQNDYNPTGLADAAVLEITPSGANRTITGIQGGATGRLLFVHNMDGSNNLVLSHEGAASAAANRIVHAQGIDETLPVYGGCLLRYASDSRWHIVGDSV